MELRIDPEFEQLIQPLTAEERQQLEANLTAEGCRDPLSVWPTAGGPPILLDGDHRYTICAAHNLPFDVVAIHLESREEARRWIITNQLGRRNLAPLQKDVLIGRRYELEKGIRGGDQKSKSENPTLNVADELAQEYQVSRDTVITDGQFVQGLDELQKIREDLPRSIVTKRSQPQTRGTHGAGPPVTKARVITVGKLIRDQQVTPPPFMRHGDWKDFQILEGLSLLAQIPLEEHAYITAMLLQPAIPPHVSLQILKNLRARGAEGRQVIYRLFASDDPRERTLAMTLAAELAPMPDPQMSRADRLMSELDQLAHRLRDWAKAFPHEPWIPKLQGWRDDLQRIHEGLEALQEDIRAAHIEDYRDP